MIKLLKHRKVREGIQVFVSLIIFAVRLWLSLKLPYDEKTRTKNPGRMK